MFRCIVDDIEFNVPEAESIEEGARELNELIKLITQDSLERFRANR